MNRKTLSLALVALLGVALLATGACKSSGMAVTDRGQLLKINIHHPTDLPDNGEDNLDIEISNRGVQSIDDVMIDVEIPPQLIVLDQTSGRGINVSHDPGTNMYHYRFGKIQPGESSMLRFKVRTAFGTMRETGSVKVTAWQSNLPGDKLIETAVIKMRQ